MIDSVLPAATLGGVKGVPVMVKTGTMMCYKVTGEREQR